MLVIIRGGRPAGQGTLKSAEPSLVYAAPTAPIPKTTRFGRPELLWVGAVCAAVIYYRKRSSAIDGGAAVNLSLPAVNLSTVDDEPTVS